MVAKNSQWEDYMVELLEAKFVGFIVQREYRFDKPIGDAKQRRWRFDAAIPELNLAFELEGAVWSKGRHVQPAGYEKDLEKYNTALLQGWAVYRFVPRMLNQNWIEQIVEKYL